MATQAFQERLSVPWCVRTRWNNCLTKARNITCICTHIHREGNQVANAFATHGQSLSPFASQWWDFPPSFILSLLARDMTGQPFQRLVFG